MSKLRLVLIALLVFQPALAEAAVMISEIAWMGTDVSDTDEWIELYNDGTESVALSGWTITPLGTAPNITLTGTIAAGGYYLLERTDDTSVPDVAMDQKYTGALSNGGDTLVLKDASGNAVDTVVGGENWENIGGDNATKETPQRSGTSWTTARPTPRAANIAGDTEEEEEDEETASTTPVVTVGGTAPSTASNVESPRRTISVDAGSDRIVLAGVPTPYSAVAYSKNERVIDDAEITWNFGDGTRLSGEEAMHAYEAAGEYVLTVRAEYKEAETLRTLRVVVEEADVTVVPGTDGVRLVNNTGRLADLSGWELKTADAQFVLPEDTALWPGGSALFPASATGLATGTQVALSLPEGKTLAIGEPEAPAEVAAVPPPKPQAPRAGIQKVKEVDLPAPIPVPVHEDVVEAPAAVPLQAAAGAALTPRKSPAWLLCLLGGALACSAVLAVP